MQSPWNTIEFLIVAAITLLYCSGILAASIVGMIAWWRTKDPKTLAEQVFQTIGATNFLRMATVIIIIYAAMVLGVAGKLDSGVSSLLSGIAGYVLGGLGSDKNHHKNE